MFDTLSVDFVPVHNMMVKDIAIVNPDRQLLLSTSIDKTLKLVALNDANSVVLRHVFYFRSSFARPCH